jgi:hypothetical protein
VIEAGVGVIGGMVAPVVTTNDDKSIRDYMGPFVDVRVDATTGGWRTISSSGLTADDFCRHDSNTGDRDCSDPLDKPVLSCALGFPSPCSMTAGFYLKNNEIAPDPIRLGIDNWRMVFRVTP